LNYDKLLTQIDEEMFVLQSFDKNITDFVTLARKGEKLRVRQKLRIEKKLSFAIKHHDRIICNS